MFHNLHLSTQPQPPFSLSTFLAHVSQSSSSAQAPIFISHLSSLNLSHISQPFSQLPIFISQPFSQPLITTPNLHLLSLDFSHSPHNTAHHLHLSSLDLSHSPPSQPPITAHHFHLSSLNTPQHLHLSSLISLNLSLRL